MALSTSIPSALKTAISVVQKNSNSGTAYQVLNPTALKAYKPGTTYKDPATGVIYLNAGVTPISGTFKEVALPVGAPQPQNNPNQLKAPLVNPITGDRKAVVMGSPAESALNKQGYGLEGAKKGTLAVTTLGAGPGAETRAGMETLGYTYIGSLEAKDAAIRAGKHLVFKNGSYYLDKTSGVQTTTDARANLNNGSDTNSTTGPTAPNLVDTYNKLRADNNLDNLESQVNDVNKSINDLDAAYLAGTHKVEGQLAPMEILQGRTNVLQQQYNEQRTVLVNQQNELNQQITQKNNVISQMMTLTQQDYTNARSAYNDSFDQALQLQQLHNTEQNTAQDNARANLNILANAISTSGKNWNDVSASMKTSIQQLELQAGLPAGSMQTFITTKPKANLLATVNGTDSSGNDIVTFVYADENGNPGMVRTLKTGGYTVPKTTNNTLSTTDQKYYNTQDYNSSLAALSPFVVTGGSKGTPEELLKNNKTYYTREQAISMLAAQYPDQNIADISKDVYAAFPDTYRILN